ncbi:c-type cytochrome biogenesis protein CcmI [Roseovarius sp. Pro17]|uniref:c-type cytochrome biogenesis protein CcmI n=1 Tax=Roseovarius sp. Pro17 TaxID=3108175 RepID=UPI002D76EB53|nr:c-type cytochrome biogenesis protein CcmI [Roseovarius sp. Pro17]
MMFWIVAAALALGTSALIAATLMRGRASAAPPAAYDIGIYRVQLRDVDKDLARGTITEGEAGRLRAEVSRRILAADAQVQAYGVDGGQPRRAGAILAALLVAVVTGGAIAGYLSLGAPGYRDLPRAERLAASDMARGERLDQQEAEARFGPDERPVIPSEDFAQLMTQLRAAIETRPDDVRGLMLLARNEASLGNTRAARRAQARLIEIKGNAAVAADHAFLADLMITAAGGYVSSEAETSLRAALLLNPGLPEARYYLGLYYAQVDRPDAAFRTWRELLEDSPADAAWIMPLRERIGDAATRAGIRYTLPDAPQTSPQANGPTAEQIEDAEGMTDEGRQAFIRSMVEGLMARLADEGGPPQDWARLITALGVLGETDRADAIWTEARATFAEQPDALALLREAADGAGLNTNETDPSETAQ